MSRNQGNRKMKELIAEGLSVKFGERDPEKYTQKVLTHVVYCEKCAPYIKEYNCRFDFCVSAKEMLQHLKICEKESNCPIEQCSFYKHQVTNPDLPFTIKQPDS